MKNGSVLVIALAVLLFPTVAEAQGIVVDHTSLHLFDQIPEPYLQAARNMKVLFMDRSVGVNMNDALNCLTASRYGAAPITCRRDYQQTNGAWALVARNDSDLASGAVPDYIRFDPSPTRYDRTNWSFYLFHDTWDKMAVNFITGLQNRAIPAQAHPTGTQVSLDPLSFDVVSFQFSYLNVDEGSSITNFFTRLPGNFDDAYDLEREVGETLTNANPPRVFVYWTTSLARGIGTDAATDFNNQMRQWCASNNRVLFDFADILAHDMAGRPCYDNRDGVSYTTPSGGASENHPNDGRSVPAICQEKTTETDGGHLSTAQGLVSVAKGFWITMARVAGWNPSGNPEQPDPPRNLRTVP